MRNFSPLPSKLIKISLVVLVAFGMLGFGLPASISSGAAQEGLPIFVQEKPSKKLEKPLYAPDEIIVKFKPGVAPDSINQILKGQDVSEKYESKFAKFKVLKIPKGGSVAELVEVFKQNPSVEYAEPNYYAYASMVPNDPLYSYQWHFDNPTYGGIHMQQAWDKSTGSPNVKVAVIDTGVAYENYRGFEQAPDLANTSFVAGYDFINKDTHPNDDEGHGTHVTGTIAQSTNNNLGVAGVAFNTTIMPVKVLDAAGSGTYDQVADGIYYAADNGAKVINMSLGGSSPATVLEDAVAYASNDGVTIIAASGNEADEAGYTGGISYPAAYDNYVIAVGATRYDEGVAYYSNYGSSLDLTAPGGDITVDQNNDGYGDGVLQQTFGTNPKDWGYWFYQGTSMATPHVSGLAALLLSQDPSRTPDQIRTILQSTAEDKGTAGWDQYYGYGLIDAQAALNYIVTLTHSDFPADSWRMFSVPLTPSNPDPEALLSDDIGNVFSDWVLGQWQPFGEVYKYHKATCCPWAQSTTSTLSFSPGRGYWLITRLGPYNIDATGTLVPNSDYYVHLSAGPTPEAGGWNQIGVPFNYSVAWLNSTIKVKNTATGQIVDLDTAQANNWLENKIWWWDGSQYQFAIAPAGQLDPWAGYWVHNFIECDLIVSPTAISGAGAASLSALTKTKPELKNQLPRQIQDKAGWKIQLSASAASEQDVYNFIGISKNSQDAYDAQDVLEPPTITSGIQLYFPHLDWSFNPGNYTQDIKKSDLRDKEWNFEIKSPSAQAITLKWSGLEQVARYQLSLIDLDANQTIDLYNISEYIYNSEQGGVRHFKLSAKLTRTYSK
ncbi:MAG: S8 family serine peptidase [Candidatus Doudnabacteria bacterium]